MRTRREVINIASQKFRLTSVILRQAQFLSSAKFLTSYCFSVILLIKIKN